VTLSGTQGRIEIEIPFNAPANRPTRLFYQQGHDLVTLDVDACNQYTIQGDLFSQAILNKSQAPVLLHDALATMRTIEAIVRSAREERRVHF